MVDEEAYVANSPFYYYNFVFNTSSLVVKYAAFVNILQRDAVVIVGYKRLNHTRDAAVVSLSETYVYCPSNNIF